MGLLSAALLLPTISYPLLRFDEINRATNAGADINSRDSYLIDHRSSVCKDRSSRHVWCGADACSRMLNWEDRSTCVLFGDGASAVLLSRNDLVGVQSHFTRTDGGGCAACGYAGGSEGYR